MANIRKFTFDLRFDDPGEGFPEPNPSPGDTFYAAPPEPEPIPEPEPEPESEPQGPQLLYTEEDMEIAREEAYVAGHMRALEESQVAAQQASANALNAVKLALDGLQPVLETNAEQVADLAAQVAAEICRKLLPHTSEAYATQEICALVKAMMPSLSGQSRLLVRVHPDLVGPIRGPLEKIAERSGFEGKLLVVDGDDMALSDARVEWPDGGAERNTSRLWEDVDDLIARNIPHFSRDEALELPGDPHTSEDSPWEDLDVSGYWAPPSFRHDLHQSLEAEAESAPKDEAAASSAEEDDPFAMFIGDEEDDTAENDLDDFALTPEQEAELAALDARLADQQKAVEDEEQEK